MDLAKLLLRREDRFSSLLLASAEGVLANVKALEELFRSASPAVSLRSFLQARVREQEIKAEIDTLLCRQHGTSLDHADIEALARALNRIAKGLRKLAERYLICATHIRDVHFTPQLRLLGVMAETLRQMVAELGAGLRVAAAKEHTNALDRADEEADKQFLENVVGLYQGAHPPMQAIMLKDLYEEFDRVFDRCRHTGDLILQIVLKHS